MTTAQFDLVTGKLTIPGIEIINKGERDWAKLNPGDYRMRPSGTLVNQIIVHTTKGIHPQKVLPGRGAGGRDRHVADFWYRDPVHSAAHIVVDNDGSVVVLAHLLNVAAYHATISNYRSIGIEMYQELGGGIHEAVYATTIKLVCELCALFGIPLQVPTAYAGVPIRRMLIEATNRNCVGVFGHRDNTHSRGRGDPGDEFFRRLVAARAKTFNYDRGEDLDFWKRVQRRLNDEFGANLKADGVCGPSTVKALRSNNLWNDGVVLGLLPPNP